MKSETLSMKSETLRDYTTADGRRVVVTFCQWGRTKAIVRLDVDGALMCRAHLVAPFKLSAQATTRGWEHALLLTPKREQRKQ